MGAAGDAAGSLRFPDLRSAAGRVPSVAPAAAPPAPPALPADAPAPPPAAPAPAAFVVLSGAAPAAPPAAPARHRLHRRSRLHPRLLPPLQRRCLHPAHFQRSLPEHHPPHHPSHHRLYHSLRHSLLHPLQLPRRHPPPAPLAPVPAPPAICLPSHPAGFAAPRAAASVIDAVACIATPCTRNFASSCCAGYFAVIVAASPTVPD